MDSAGAAYIHRSKHEHSELWEGLIGTTLRQIGIVYQLVELAYNAGAAKEDLEA